MPLEAFLRDFVEGGVNTHAAWNAALLAILATFAIRATVYYWDKGP